MNRAFTLLALFAIAITMALALYGCSGVEAAAGGFAAGAGGLALLEYTESNQIVEGAIEVAGKEAAIFGLNHISPDKQKAAAQALVDACDDASKYLQSGALPTADIVNQLISQKFKNVHPTLLVWIQDAAWVLGKFVPSANVYLTPAQIGDLVSFLNGVESGAKTFLVNPQVETQCKYTGKHSKKRMVRVGDAAPAFPNWFEAQ